MQHLGAHTILRQLMGFWLQVGPAACLCKGGPLGLAGTARLQGSEAHGPALPACERGMAAVL